MPDHPYRMLTIGGFGSGKTNLLFNLINQHSDIDKTHLYSKDPFDVKYQIWIKKRESTGLKLLNDSKDFIECSNHMDNIYKDIKEYNSNINVKYWLLW